MHSMTVIVLACLVAVAFAHTQYEYQPAEELVNIPEDAAYNTPEHLRPKRSLLLLKKKLLLGALGLKAAKVGAVGAVGALALKKAKSVHSHSHHQHHVVVPHSHWKVEVHH
ncbi:hypothetical protein ACJJTC_008049 [Scirpophaga incertulas]